MTPDILEQAKQLYANGHSLAMVGRQLGLDASTVPQESRREDARHAWSASLDRMEVGASYNRTSCGTTGQDLIPVGNPRSHTRGGPSPHTV
jgi:hypothetical protein